MKRYYERMGNFANIYDLAWADNTADCKALEELGFERISRKFAIKECKAEEFRKQYGLRHITKHEWLAMDVQ